MPFLFKNVNATARYRYTEITIILIRTCISSLQPPINKHNYCDQLLTITHKVPTSWPVPQHFLPSVNNYSLLPADELLSFQKLSDDPSVAATPGLVQPTTWQTTRVPWPWSLRTNGDEWTTSTDWSIWRYLNSYPGVIDLELYQVMNERHSVRGWLFISHQPHTITAITHIHIRIMLRVRLWKNPKRVVN